MLPTHVVLYLQPRSVIVFKRIVVSSLARQSRKQPIFVELSGVSSTEKPDKQPHTRTRRIPPRLCVWEYTYILNVDVCRCVCFFFFFCDRFLRCCTTTPLQLSTTMSADIGTTTTTTTTFLRRQVNAEANRIVCARSVCRPFPYRIVLYGRVASARCNKHGDNDRCYHHRWRPPPQRKHVADVNGTGL